MQRRIFIGGAVAATVAGVTAATAAPTEPLHQSGPGWFTNVEVQAHDGKTYRFYDDLMKDKIVLVNFFYTDCDLVCPLATENLAYVHELFGARMGKDIFMYSISLQPARDTPAKLAAYAERFGVGAGWLMLTGQPDNIELLRRRLGFVDSDPVTDADLEQHLGTVRIGNVPKNRWAMSPSLLNPTAIVRTVKRVIPEPA